MENTIITYGKSYLIGSPPTYLKVQSLLKGLGFEDVKIGFEIGESQYFEKMTLMIHPRAMRSLNGGGFLIPNEATNKWKQKSGYKHISILHIIKNYDEGGEGIIIDGVHMGDYYRKRNVVMFFFPIYNTQLSMGLKNDFLFYLLEKFKKEIERLKIKKADVSNKMREDLINKFLDGIKKSIMNFDYRIKENLLGLDNHRKKEITYLSDNHQLKEQIKVLKGTQKAMGEGIENKIAEIRKLSFVKRVGISNLGIRVDFRKIDLDHNGKKVELGECYCYLNPTNLEIKNKNFVKYEGQTYHSPHISGNSICFGNGKTKAYDLLASLKFKELVYFIYLYLKTYNEGDTYINIRAWEKCKREDGVLTARDNDEDNDDEDEDYYVEDDD